MTALHSELDRHSLPIRLLCLRLSLRNFLFGTTEYDSEEAV